jgi:hypothetical protein
MDIKKALEEIKEITGQKNVSTDFVRAWGDIKFNSKEFEEFKLNVKNLIKEKKELKVFGALYKTFDKLAQEHIDSLLENDFLLVEIGLSVRK